MTIEKQLKDLVLRRYKSILEFTQYANIPNTTFDSILRRGIGNSSISNVSKVCKALCISLDGLADGKIVPKYSEYIPVETVELKDLTREIKVKLSDINHLTIEGKDIDIESADPIIEALNIGYEMVRKKSEPKLPTKTRKSPTKTTL